MERPTASPVPSQIESVVGSTLDTHEFDDHTENHEIERGKKRRRDTSTIEDDEEETKARKSLKPRVKSRSELAAEIAADSRCVVFTGKDRCGTCSLSNKVSSGV